MWDTLKKLEYRAKAGIPDAQLELACRRNDRTALPLVGIHGEQLYLTGARQLQKQAEELDALYAKLPIHRGVQNTILLDAWSSATIEGARTTVDQVCQSFDHPKTKDDRMVVNAIHGSNYAYSHSITQKNIRRLWEMVVDGVCENAGKAGSQYRSGRVFIGNSSRIIHEPASPEQLPDMMESWFCFRESNDLHPIVAAFICHFYFVYVHPFCDGNGRTVRILNASELYHKGYRKMKSLPLSGAINSQLSGYYSSLADSELVISDGAEVWLDLSPFVSYMMEAMQRCMIDAALSENNLNVREIRLLERMNKAGASAEITIRKASEILDCSDSTARKVLLSLVQKGYLTESADSNPHRYQLHQHLPGQ